MKCSHAPHSDVLVSGGPYTMVVKIITAEKFLLPSVIIALLRGQHIAVLCRTQSVGRNALGWKHLFPIDIFPF